MTYNFEPTAASKDAISFGWKANYLTHSWVFLHRVSYLLHVASHSLSTNRAEYHGKAAGLTNITPPLDINTRDLFGAAIYPRGTLVQQSYTAKPAIKEATMLEMVFKLEQG